LPFNSPRVLLQQGGFFLLSPVKGLNDPETYKFFFKGAFKKAIRGVIQRPSNAPLQKQALQKPSLYQ
ncbi:hypothetical protein, partial [Thermococcus sp.]|uniref:hypothetical protein n=1 Tax=Thermococcus sp. TaxID=35749 RepID=UPI002625B037